jgi:hypothetical protein
MALAFSTTLRNARADAITTAAGSACKFAIYDGARPASGGAATTKLAEFTFAANLAAAASNGVLTFNLPPNATGLAAGTATWGRITTSGGTFVIDLSAGSDFTLNTTTVSIGLTVQLTSGSITEGNA